MTLFLREIIGSVFDLKGTKVAINIAD